MTFLRRRIPLLRPLLVPVGAAQENTKKCAVLPAFLFVFTAAASSAQQISNPREITLLIDSGASIVAGVNIKLNGKCRALVPLHALRGARAITVTKGIRTTHASLEWPLNPTDEDQLFDLAVLKYQGSLGNCLPFEDIKDDARLVGPTDTSQWKAVFYGYEGAHTAAEFSRTFTGDRHLRAGVYYWKMPETFRRGSSGAPLILAGQMIGIVWGFDRAEKFGYVLTNTSIRSRLGRNYPVMTAAAEQ